jgi:ammonia channel protein AmtB
MQLRVLPTEVADVPGAARQAQHFTLNPDGERHLVSNALALVTLVLGLVSFALGMIVRNAPTASAALHITATVAGGVAVVIGLYVQMISSSRPERIVIMTGIIAGFVGASLGLAAGGL